MLFVALLPVLGFDWLPCEFVYNTWLICCLTDFGEFVVFCVGVFNCLFRLITGLDWACG